MDILVEKILFGLKFFQLHIITLLVYICYQVYVINRKSHYSLIFKGWLFNLFQILLLIPVTFSVLFNLEPITEVLLLSFSKFFDLLGGLFILVAVRDRVSESQWAFIKYIPPTTNLNQICFGFVFSLICCIGYFGNKTFFQYYYFDNRFSALLLIPSVYVLSLSYYTLHKYYNEYFLEKKETQLRFLVFGALIYSAIQILPPIFELVSDTFPEDNMDIFGYTLGLISKIFIIIGLHHYLIPELPDEIKIAERISKKKDLISEAFHEIEGMGDLIQESLDELTESDNAYKYQINGKTAHHLKIIEENNLRNIEILSSYRRLFANLTTGDYEKDTEKVMDDEKELKDDINVNVIVNMASAIVKSKFPNKGVKIIKDLGGVDKIKCRQFEFYQMLKIILINAFEACPEKGRIWIKTFTTRVEKQKFVNISISDNGYGIKNKNLSLIFDEDFSTKPLNDETWKRGHGLPTLSKLCLRYGFSISLVSQDNSDFLNDDITTEFLITIPK